MANGELDICESLEVPGLQGRHWRLPPLLPLAMACQMTALIESEEILLGGFIAHLTSLQTLHLRDTQVTGDFSKVRGLTNLQTLNLYKTQLTGDIDNLRALTSLEKLYLSFTQVQGEVS